MKNKNHHPNREHSEISWVAPEYIQHHKSREWYIGAAVLAVLVIIIDFISQNWTMALAVITFAAVYKFTQEKHPPKNIAIIITEMGIHVGEMFFPFSHIEAFWIIYSHGVKTLNLRVKGRFYSDVEIQLDDQNPGEIRKYLLSRIPEWEGKNEPFIDSLLRLLKF